MRSSDFIFRIESGRLILVYNSKYYNKGVIAHVFEEIN